MPMDPEKKYAIKRMLASAGSAANGIRLLFEQGRDPVSRKIASSPHLMMKIFDDLRGRLAEYYDQMTEDEINSVIAFYSTPAGKAYNAATLNSVPHIEGVLESWKQDVLAEIGKMARGEN